MKREETYKVSWTDAKTGGRNWRFFTDRAAACKYAHEVASEMPEKYSVKHLRVDGEVTTTERWRLDRHEWEFYYE